VLPLSPLAVLESLKQLFLAINQLWLKGCLAVEIRVVVDCYS